MADQNENDSVQDVLNDCVFFDTSIQIARVIHHPRIRSSIEDIQKQFLVSVTGLISRREFKQRVLGDCRYLLERFRREEDFDLVLHTVTALPNAWSHGRKKQLCTQILVRALETARISDEDRTDVATDMLWMLLQDGLYHFDRSVTSVVKHSGCVDGKRGVTIKEKRNGSREPVLNLGHCPGKPDCSIESFLNQQRPNLGRIVEFADANPKTFEGNRELEKAVSFVRNYLRDGTCQTPCGSVGDLLIALESVASGARTMYSLDAAASKFYTEVFDQQFIRRPTNPREQDVIERPISTSQERVS